MSCGCLRFKHFAFVTKYIKEVKLKVLNPFPSVTLWQVNFTSEQTCGAASTSGFFRGWETLHHWCSAVTLCLTPPRPLWLADRQCVGCYSEHGVSDTLSPPVTLVTTYVTFLQLTFTHVAAKLWKSTTLIITELISHHINTASCFMWILILSVTNVPQHVSPTAASLKQ